MAEFEPLTGKAARSVELATARFNVWEGSVRSGKTVASIFAWLKFVREVGPGDLLMVGKTRDTIYRNVITVIEQMIGRRARYNHGTGVLMLFGRKIYVIGANDVQAEMKIRGMTLIGAYVDEATILPESFWRMLGTRLSMLGARLYATTNPDNPRHWLKTGYLDKAGGWLHSTGKRAVLAPPEQRINLHRFSFELADNPTLNPEYLEALNAEYTGLWRKRFILGEWVIAEGAIYDMWDDERYVISHSDLPTMERMLVLGVDYGTRNPFAAVLLGIAAGRLYCVDQYRWDSAMARAQRTSAQYSADLKEFYAGRTPEWIYVDPSAAEFRNQMFQDGHQGVMAADNSVVDGIRTVASLLSRDKLMVSDRCSGLIGTFPGYAWDDKAALKGEDKPIKVDDHDLDALRYAVHSSGWAWRYPLGMTDTTGAERHAA